MLVRYPISNANGVHRLDGEAQEHITVSPLAPSKQLGGNESRGVFGNTSGDYLTSAWPSGELRNQGKFFEFKITAQNGLEIEYEKLEFTLYSLKDKKTHNSLGRVLIREAFGVVAQGVVFLMVIVARTEAFSWHLLI